MLKPHAIVLPLPDLQGLERDPCNPKHPPYVHAFGAYASGAPDILLSALVHGNEIAGALVLADLVRCWQHERWQPRVGRVTVVFANVDAFLRFDAHAPDASRYVQEDFNRVWGASLDTSEATLERQRARALRPFVERASHLLDLHSMHEPGTPLWVTGVLSRNIALAQSLGTGCQAIIDKGHADGVRMRDHAAFGDPHSNRLALLLEAGQHWEASSVAVTRNAVARFLASTPLISDAAPTPAAWRAPDESPPLPVEVTHRVVARGTDFHFVREFVNLETIDRAGTVIAWNGSASVVTPYDQCVLVMPSLRQLQAGVTIVRLGRRVLPAPLGAPSHGPAGLGGAHL